MFLKSLTLKGFKSFAEPTTLDFEPGVTVVVGPNGSGKSNIVDAVAWVLGAQGPRSLRSNKMEDVIFAGSAKRAALGRAEVSLTIDNSSHLLPIDFAEVTITRTLFRSSGESEYAINGVPCRLLDVQELLSDTRVGRTQHVIVSQGQLDAVLNARPEERRLMVEEAAGVLKYRRRKEKAERRLEATEGNLLRLQDLLREVRRQLRPLERQAEAARRHGDVVAELTALRTHLLGREIAGLQSRAGALAGMREDLAAQEAQVKARLASLDVSVLAAEAALSSSNTNDLGDLLGRAESLREKARGLAALLAERRRSALRDRSAGLDRDVVATLEADAARLRGELDEVEAEAARLVPRAEELAEAEQALADERAASEEDSDELSATSEAAEVRGELGALRAAVERGRSEQARLESRIAGLDSKAVRLREEADRLRSELAERSVSDEPLVAAADVAGADRAAAEERLAAAEAAVHAVESERAAWVARAEGLALALDEARSKAGAERLAAVDGVLGTLLEQVEVDEGWEAAFEAAAGEALTAILVEDGAAARRALAVLKDGATTGAVLPLGTGVVAGTLPWDGEPVRAHVRSQHAAVDRALDTLLGTAVVVDGGWETALDIALRNPGAVVVTRDGDRFSPAGWRVGASGSGATGAALDEARRRAEDATAEALAAQERLRLAHDVAVGARVTEADRLRTLEDNDDRLAAAGDALQRHETEVATVATESAALRSHLDELVERLAREGARVDELEAALPGLEAEEAAGAERVAARRSARARMEERAAAVATLRTDIEVRAAGLDERRGFLTRRLAEIEARLEADAASRTEAATRRSELDGLVTATDRLAALVADRLAVLETELAELRERRRRQVESLRRATEHLDELRRERVAAERRLEELRERARRAEVDDAEVRMRLETAVETVRRELDCEPDVAIKAECPELPPGTTAPHRVRELERDLRLMGPINPLALEEFTALQERHGFLEAQLEDVKGSRRELAKVIRAVDAEIVEVVRAAYADVAENYERLFETLFPGGSGRLRLTDPDNLLETGIELEARPPGKNVRKLSLLSGGERSLTAMAFLFAIFRSRPSPFYLLDEVEAALDDVNLHRFLDLVHEFREEAQLLVVSHQKRTMEAADCLYGVTMQPGGSSRVISEKVAAGA